MTKSDPPMTPFRQLLVDLMDHGWDVARSNSREVTLVPKAGSRIVVTRR